MGGLHETEPDPTYPSKIFIFKFENWKILNVFINSIITPSKVYIFDALFFAQLVTTDELKKEDDDEASASKKIKIEIPLEEQVLMSQIPFYSIDYEEQVIMFYCII